MFPPGVSGRVLGLGNPCGAIIIGWARAGERQADLSAGAFTLMIVCCEGMYERETEQAELDGEVPMSRLDQIAAMMKVSTDSARQFTRSVRDYFDEAPSYAQIVEALRALPTPKPSAQQVAAEIKRKQAERAAKRAERTGKPVPSTRRPPARQRGEKPKRTTSLHHKKRYSRKKPTEKKQEE